MHTEAVNHAPGQLMMNTGAQQFGRPSFGSWALYGLGSETADLPGYVVLSSASGTSGGASNYGCGFLPTSYAGTPFRGSGDPILYLSNPKGFDQQTQRASLDSLRRLNELALSDMGDPEIAARIQSYETAFQLQTSAPELMNLASESRPILGDMLVRSLQVPIALISTGQGGTKAGSWQPLPDTAPLVERPNPDRDAKDTSLQPGEGPYLQLLRLARMLGPKGVKAVLWHQGYSDARDGTTSEQYVQSMIDIIESLNSDAGYRIPWMVAQEAVAPYPESDSQAIRHGQQVLWNSPLVYQGPTTDDMLGPKFRHDMDHFNELGLRIHAERWFAMLWSQFYAVVPIGVPHNNS